MPGTQPLISVIIPVFNDSENLRHCLHALRQSTLTAFELIVVDDGSNDDSALVASSAGATLVPTGKQIGPAAARNLGAQKAGAPLLFFADADVCLDPKALALAVETLHTHPEISAVIGSYDDHPFAQGFISQYKNLFHRFVHQTARRDASTFWTGCGAIRRDVFHAMGGFDTSYRRPSIEDIELGARMVHAGHRILLCPQMQAQHRKRWTLWGLIRTDLFDRAIPWARLIRKNHTMPDDLNLKHSQRLSALLACALIPVFAAALILSSPLWAAVGVAMLIAVIALNHRFYRFFWSERGWWFALRAVPLHLLYYWYSVLGFILGCLTYGRSPIKPALE